MLVHTMEELRLSGNHLKGSRPVLSFDKTFDEQPHYRLTKELLKQVMPIDAAFSGGVVAVV